MRGGRGHEELNVADFEVGVLLQDTRSELEERHEQTREKKLELWLPSRRVFEIVHYSIDDYKQEHIL